MIRAPLCHRGAGRSLWGSWEGLVCTGSEAREGHTRLSRPPRPSWVGAGVPKAARNCCALGKRQMARVRNGGWRAMGVNWHLLSPSCPLAALLMMLGPLGLPNVTCRGALGIVRAGPAEGRRSGPGAGEMRSAGRMTSGKGLGALLPLPCPRFCPRTHQGLGAGPFGSEQRGGRFPPPDPPEASRPHTPWLRVTRSPSEIQVSGDYKQNCI